MLELWNPILSKCAFSSGWFALTSWGNFKKAQKTCFYHLSGLHSNKGEGCFFFFYLHICCSSVWESECVLYVFFTRVGLKFCWFKKIVGCSFIEDLKIGRVLMAIMLQSIPWKLYKVAARSRSSSWIFSVCLIQSNHHFWSCTVIAFSDAAEGWANQK